MVVKIKNKVIKLVKGDITEMDVDAIVNAANEHLAHGAGVAGAIVRKGGLWIQQESNDWVKNYGRVKTGDAAITSGGQLKAKYVIHAVGPVLGSGDEDSKLASATQSALMLADKYKIKSIAFPAISTGIYGYPIERCAHIMISTAIRSIPNIKSVEEIVFCLWDDFGFSIFTDELSKYSENV